MNTKPSYFQSALDNCPDEFWSLDRDFKILHYNSALKKGMETLLGVKIEEGESILESFRSIGLGAIADYYKEFYERALKGETFMLEINTPVGEKVYYREQYFSPLWVDGSIAGITIYSRDVTEKVERQLELSSKLEKVQDLNNKLKQREEEIAASEEELKQTNEELMPTVRAYDENQLLIETLQTQAKIGIFTQVLETGVMEFSRSLLEMNELGNYDRSISVEELSEGLDPSYMPILEKAMQNLVSTGEPVSAEFPKILPSGKHVWQRLSALAFDYEGTIRGKIIGFVFDITVFKETQQQLTFNETKFRTVSNLSTDAIYDWDLETNVAVWNEGANILYELDPEAIFTIESWEEMIHPEDLHRVVESLHQAIDQPETSLWLCDYRILTKNSRVAYITDTGKFLRDPQGKAFRMIGAMRDLTEIRNYEESLRQSLDHEKKLNEELSTREEELASSEEELLQLNENLRLSIERIKQREFLLSEAEKVAKMGNWEFDLNTSKGIWSANLFKIFGEEEQKESVSINYALSFFTGKSYEVVEKAIKNCKNLGRSFDVEVEAILPGNLKKWIRMSGSAVFYDDKEIDGSPNSYVGAIRGITQDISYYKEIEARVRASEDKFYKAFHLSPDMINLIREEDLQIVDINDRIVEVLGYSREELLGKKSYELNIWHNPMHREEFFRQLKENGKVKMSAELHRKNGEVFEAEINVERIIFGKEPHLLSVIRDVSKSAKK